MGHPRTFGEQPLEARSEEPSLPTPNIDSALIIPSRTPAEKNVSMGDALGLIAGYRAVQVISTSTMQISFDAVRGDETLDKPLVLRRPDPDESIGAFIEKTTLSLALNGNAFWRVFRDNQGRVTGLRVLNPLDVTIHADTDGNVLGYKYARREALFTKSEVQHLSFMRVPGDPRGRGPIQSTQAELYGAIQARDYATVWYEVGAVPSGILSSSATLNGESSAAAKKQFMESNGGRSTIAVLGQGFSYQPVYLDPEDAQWIQVRQYDTTAITRLFGIPASVMLAAVEGSSQTYSNITQAWAEFQKTTLARYVQEIEDAFSAVLPRGTEAKANYAALLAPDIQTRYQLHALAIQAGFMSVNEARAIEGYEPAPDGDFKTAEQKIAEQQAFAPSETPEEEETAGE